MKIGFVSLGCCKNLVDSEQIMGMIKRGGHEIVANPKDAQAIIVNTCGFIESAKNGGVTTMISAGECHTPGRPKDPSGTNIKRET